MFGTAVGYNHNDDGVIRRLMARLTSLNQTVYFSPNLPKTGLLQVIQVIPCPLSTDLQAYEVEEAKTADNGLFVFKPQSKQSKFQKVSTVQYVAGEAVDVKIRIHNCLGIPVMIESVSFVTANKEGENCFLTHPAKGLVPGLTITAL
eukprot:jgi/Bigna1/138456/aug1.45_g13164